MKTSLIALLALALSVGAVRAVSPLTPHLGLALPPSTEVAVLPALSLASSHSPASSSFSLRSSSSDFAQLSTTPTRLPFTFSPGLIMACVAMLVLALRIIGLNHARALAEHERDSYRGKAQMFRSLHEGGSNR